MLVQRNLSIDINYSFNNFPDYGVDKYNIGTGFGHFGIAVEDVSFPTLNTTTISH